LSASAPSLSAEVDVALEAARAASALTRRVQEEISRSATLTKGDKSPVTVADFGAQAVVNRVLEMRFPRDAVMGEEASAELRAGANRALLDRVAEEVARVFPRSTDADALRWIDRATSAGGSGRFWALDPVDGTKGFLRGEQYAVALALLEGGVVLVGALSCPNLPFGSERGVIFLASRGGGTWATGIDGGTAVRVRASAESDPRRARLLESVEAAHGDHGSHARIQRHLAVGGASIRLDSQAKYGVLARGDAEIYLRMPTSAEYRENLWDQAAGAIVIEEAGGRVSDARGARLDFTTGRRLERNRGIVATNGALHEAVLSAIRAVGELAP
jgi:3'(2'), 5'-bisphosphate nucleotidase